MALKKRVDTIFRRECVRQLKISSKLSALAMILFFGILVTPSTLLADTEPTKIIDPAILVFDPSSSQVLKLGEKSLPKIILGESQIDRDSRLKAEAEAAAKAKILAQKAQRDAIARERVVYSDPVDFNSIYQNAGIAFGVDPLILKAIHIVETGASGSTSRSSYAGAVGPMQFLPSTFRSHAVDGDGDGRKDITNVSDAIFTAAKYLRDCGYPNIKQALWGYNPSTSYFNKVMRIAYSLGYEK